MKRTPLVPALLVLILVVLGAAFLFLRHDAAPTADTTASSTAPVTNGQPATPTQGAKPPVKTTQSPTAPATSSAPAATQSAFVAHLSVAPKDPAVNTAPPVAAVTLTFALDSYVPQKKDAPHDSAFYTVDYGDGTSGAFSFQGVDTKGGAHELWIAADHTYRTPGTYTARALRSGVEISSTTFKVFGDHISPSK